MSLGSSVNRNTPICCVYQPISYAHCQGRRAKIVREYDQKIPQSETKDNPVAPRGKVAQPSRDTGKTN